MRYLSGTPYARCLTWEHGGLMLTPMMGNKRQVMDGVVWAADNGCYSAGDRFDLSRYLAFLDYWREAGCAAQCRFAVAPDVPFNMAETWARSAPTLDRIRAAGYPVALAIQNGVDPRRLAWDAFDAVFIAGDKPFKTGAAAWLVCREAKRRGKHVHIARRNSKRAMQAAYDMGADTVDGTFLKYGPDVNFARMQRWFAEFCQHPASRIQRWGDDARFGRCLACGREVWRVPAHERSPKRVRETVA